ncbi:hypothetical protein H2200_008637 [Cladophialophora chaetospira]|uniref:Uncharacterized protein n=1 Tax=Cladophialophora chaetospira TaxID=386627 RepID=A0AA38X4E6_9EURO|nr:hypothetical protein H2200_008637 [Cladophialophora chaetospira]
MSKQTKKSGKRQKRDDENDSDDSGDDDIQPIHFFVPGENINAAVLVEYINRYVDRTAKITSAQHPTDKTRTGFNVSAKRALNAVSIRDLINDSKDWDLETQSREYRRNPYDYRESDTAKRRGKKGPTEGGTNRPQQPRGKRETTTEPQDGGRREMQPITSGGPAQSQYQAASYNQYSSQSQPYSAQTTSYGYHQPGRTDQGPTNINITMNAAALAPGRVGQPGQFPSTYNTSSYGQSPRQESEPPPAYQPSVTSRGGGGAQPPAQPGPDTFDAEKPVTSRTHSGQGQDRRGSTYDQPTQPGRRR